jgi:hypothetical protein
MARRDGHRTYIFRATAISLRSLSRANEKSLSREGSSAMISGLCYVLIAECVTMMTI